MERSKEAAMAAGADASDLSGLPRRLVVAGERWRRRARPRRATSVGDGFDGVTLPAPSLGDGGGFVGVLDTISRRPRRGGCCDPVLLLLLHAARWCVTWALGRRAAA
jgi:hypothetical protein